MKEFKCKWWDGVSCTNTQEGAERLTCHEGKDCYDYEEEEE